MSILSDKKEFRNFKPIRVCPLNGAARIQTPNVDTQFTYVCGELTCLRF